VTAGSTSIRADRDVNAAVDGFRRILRALRVAARSTEVATGLSAAQLFVLSAVAESPGCSVNDIALATMTDRSSAAAMVERLADRGFVTRTRSAEDRRRAAITISASGRRALRRAPPPPTTILVSALRELSPRRLHHLSEALADVTEAMGVSDEPAGMLFEEARSSAPAKRRRRSVRVERD
jgi:DNA-binding MarR family transcriptional regulator